MDYIYPRLPDRALGSSRLAHPVPRLLFLSTLSIANLQPFALYQVLHPGAAPGHCTLVLDPRLIRAERSLRIGILYQLVSPCAPRRRLYPVEPRQLQRARAETPWCIGCTAPSIMPTQTRDRRLEATSPDPTPLRHPYRRSQADTQRPLSIEAKPNSPRTPFAGL